jgi:hypothetical protein
MNTHTEDQSMEDERELPELPPSVQSVPYWSLEFGNSEVEPTGYFYTADQMREYARAALRAPVEVTVAKFDADGHCVVCGYAEEEGVTHECPPGFAAALSPEVSSHKQGEPEAPDFATFEPATQPSQADEVQALRDALAEWEGEHCGGDCLAAPCSCCDGTQRRAGKGQRLQEALDEAHEELAAHKQGDALQEAVRALLWDEHMECCGRPEVGAQYGGMQEQVCCGCPEPALLTDSQIVASLRAMLPENAATPPHPPQEQT